MRKLAPQDDRQADDRACIGTHVDDTAPLAVHAHAAEGGKHLDDRREGALDHGKAATLAVADIGIDPGTDDEIASELVQAAHKICPYSNATRNNIDVQLKVV